MHCRMASNSLKLLLSEDRANAPPRPRQLQSTPLYKRELVELRSLSDHAIHPHEAQPESRVGLTERAAGRAAPAVLGNRSAFSCCDGVTGRKAAHRAAHPDGAVCKGRSSSEPGRALTSSFMPVSSSSITQASMGSAISRPLRFRCSSNGVPKAGFSAHLSRAANRQ